MITTNLPISRRPCCRHKHERRAPTQRIHSVLNRASPRIRRPGVRRRKWTTGFRNWRQRPARIGIRMRSRSRHRRQRPVRIRLRYRIGCRRQRARLRRHGLRVGKRFRSRHRWHRIRNRKRRDRAGFRRYWTSHTNTSSFEPYPPVSSRISRDRIGDTCAGTPLAFDRRRRNHARGRRPRASALSRSTSESETHPPARPTTRRSVRWRWLAWRVNCFPLADRRTRSS